MRLNCSYTQRIFFVECAVVFTFFLVPPLFSVQVFILPPRPTGLYAQSVFFLKLFAAAFYEELLYRYYTPNRLLRMYEIWRCKQLSHPAKPTACEKIGVFLLTEFPAIAVFALAHRYLGMYSVLFAACAGFVFRFAYIRLTYFFSVPLSIGIVGMIHGFWNLGVYCYLWRT